MTTLSTRKALNMTFVPSLASMAVALIFCTWQTRSEAAVYKCEVGGKTAYQATPCPTGPSTTIATPAPVPAPADQTPGKAASRQSEAPCQGDALSLNFQTTPLPMVLQVIADFAGRRAQIDPGVTGNPPIQYRCTPWRTVLQDIAQRQHLDIRIEDKLIFVRPR
jgi:hypothetical protein